MKEEFTRSGHGNEHGLITQPLSSPKFGLGEKTSYPWSPLFPRDRKKRDPGYEVGGERLYETKLRRLQAVLSLTSVNIGT